MQASGKCLAIALGCTLLSACGEHAAEGKDCPAAQRDHTVSGFCVPRWVSLKRGEVYGRKGAGKDYPAVYIYRVKGLPVQVVAETTDWRRVCDPDGGATWVHRSMIDGHRNIMALRRQPDRLAQGAGSDRRPRSLPERPVPCNARRVQDWLVQGFRRRILRLDARGPGLGRGGAQAVPLNRSARA